jgi:hypothetical protein
MANDNPETITGTGGSADLGQHNGRYSQLTIGQVGNEDFGGGSLLIKKLTLSGGLHIIRTITAAQFAVLQDKTIRLELPDGSGIEVELTGATDAELYVEHRNQEDR